MIHLYINATKPFLSDKIILRQSYGADPGGRAVWGVDLRLLACWDCGFESYRGHVWLSLLSVVCCQVEVSAMGWLLFQKSWTECGVSECDLVQQ
jgi:hypothetical protein